MNIKTFKYDKLKNLSYYLISSLVSMGIGVLINPFLSLGLSHNDFAIIGYYASFGSLLTPLIAFSFNQYYARNYFLVEEIERKKILNTLLSLFISFGLFILIIFLVGYYYYHNKYVSSISFSPYAILSFLPFYFSCFYNIYLLDLRMQNKAKKYAIISISNSIIAALLSILLVYFLRYGAIGRLSSLLIVASLFGIYSLKTINFKFIIDKTITVKAFSFCWPLAISALLSFFFIGIDRTFLANLNDNHSLGLYNVAIQISGYLAIFSTVILQNFEPDLYKHTSLKNHKKVVYIGLLIIGINLIPNFLFIILSKPLISLLTYGKYTEAALYANILCLKNVATTFAFIMSGILIGYGFPKFELINRIIGAILAFIMYKYFIERWGYLGAAWGQSISWIAMGLISTISLIIVKNKSNENV